MIVKLGIYGDTIRTGWWGISDRSRRWSSITCANLNLEARNFSVDGRGFIRRRDTDAYPLHPLQTVTGAQPQIDLRAEPSWVGYWNYVVEDPMGQTVELTDPVSASRP